MKNYETKRRKQAQFPCLNCIVQQAVPWEYEAPQCAEDLEASQRTQCVCCVFLGGGVG